MITRNSIMTIIRNLVGHENIVAIPKIFAQMLGGDWTAAAMLNQIVFWSGHTDDPNGWMYKTNAEWQAELYITQSQVERCLRLLKGVGVGTLIYKVGNTPKTHFYIDEDIFVKALEGTISGDFRLHENVKSDFTKTRSPTSRKREDSIRHRSQKTIDHKYVSPADAGEPPDPPSKKKKSSATKLPVWDCELFHIDGDKRVQESVGKLTFADAENCAIAYGFDYPTRVYVVVRNGKDAAWYMGAKKIRKPRDPDPIIDAIAYFCFEITGRAEISANAGHITGAGANVALLDYLRDIKNVPAGEALKPELIANTALSISKGLPGIDSMGKWWDDNHRDARNEPLARPKPHKFMIYYPKYRAWMLSQMNKEVPTPQAAKIPWISKDGQLVRPYDPALDGIPGKNTIVYAEAPEGVHE